MSDDIDRTLVDLVSTSAGDLVGQMREDVLVVSTGETTFMSCDDMKPSFFAALLSDGLPLVSKC